MITSKIELFGIEETIVRPILIIATTGIKELLAITNDIYTTYDLKDSIIKNKNKLGDVTGNNTIHDEIINVEYLETSEDNNELSRIPCNTDFKDIYRDKDIRTKITPVYHSRKMSVKFRYSNKSKSKVMSLVNKLRLYTTNDGMYKRHDLEYHYVIPNYVVRLLDHINSLKNIRLSTPIDIDTYLANTLDNRADFLNSMDGNIVKTDIAIREAQSDIQGYITDELHQIAAEYDENTTYWNIEFTYEFIYEKPISLLLTYPVLIYNTLINKEFRNFVKDKQPNIYANMSNRSNDLIDITKRGNILTKNIFTVNETKYYLTVPEFDNEQLPPPPNFTARMFSVLIIVDPDNCTELFNICDIPKIRFKGNVLNFILTSEYPYVGDLHGSMLYIDLYKDNKKDFNNKIIMDSSGNLTTSICMDITSVYRVMFSVTTDMDMLTADSKKRIKYYIRDELELLSKDIIVNKSESVIDSYLTLLNIDTDIINDAINKTVATEDIIFNIKEPIWQQYMTKEILIVHTGMLEQKGV